MILELETKMSSSPVTSHESLAASAAGFEATATFAPCRCECPPGAAGPAGGPGPARHRDPARAPATDPDLDGPSPPRLGPGHLHAAPGPPPAPRAEPRCREAAVRRRPARRRLNRDRPGPALAAARAVASAALLNFFGWILKCVCLELRNQQMTPSDIQLNRYILRLFK